MSKAQESISNDVPDGFQILIFSRILTKTCHPLVQDFDVERLRVAYSAFPSFTIDHLRPALQPSNEWVRIDVLALSLVSWTGLCILA